MSVTTRTLGVKICPSSPGTLILIQLGRLTFLPPSDTPHLLNSSTLHSGISVASIAKSVVTSNSFVKVSFAFLSKKVQIFPKTLFLLQAQIVAVFSPKPLTTPRLKDMLHILIVPHIHFQMILALKSHKHPLLFVMSSDPATYYSSLQHSSTNS